MQQGGDVRPFELLLDEMAAELGRPEIDDVVTRRGLRLWTFVHRLSVLLIDEVPAHKGLAVEGKALVDDGARARRVLPEADTRL